jgi:hypothetical protein
MRGSIVAGIRPISPLGVELEYIDFGNPSSANAITGLGEQRRVCPEIARYAAVCE